jgi:hypothetical protein
MLRRRSAKPVQSSLDALLPDFSLPAGEMIVQSLLAQPHVDGQVHHPHAHEGKPPEETLGGVQNSFPGLYGAAIDRHFLHFIVFLV